MDLKDIKAIIDLMKKNSVSEFELERQDFKIRLKRGGAAVALPQIEESPVTIALPNGPQQVGAGAQAAVTTAPQVASGEAEIKSPMIGTFYQAPSPESANYCEIGTEVNPDTVVCIIEAMKVMNEIKAEVRGVITAILVENAKPVEFGQPLYRIRPL